MERDRRPVELVTFRPKRGEKLIKDGVWQDWVNRGYIVVEERLSGNSLTLALEAKIMEELAELEEADPQTLRDEIVDTLVALRAYLANNGRNGIYYRDQLRGLCLVNRLSVDEIERSISEQEALFGSYDGGHNIRQFSVPANDQWHGYFAGSSQYEQLEPVGVT